MTYGSESECATHYTTAPHMISVWLEVWCVHGLGVGVTGDESGVLGVPDGGVVPIPWERWTLPMYLYYRGVYNG